MFDGPSRCQSPDGMGLLRHILPGGVVPTLVSQPFSVVLNVTCVFLSPVCARAQDFGVWAQTIFLG